ncbi:MAG TPA: AI-2E family transporter [Candidatus Bathyarchaeia archaeon]|nr:AI-2E family transporter [Candidatus Bathyarchaeia archaeon]
MNKTIEISSGTILRTIFILLLLWFLFLIRDILVLVFLALIIVSAIDPVVDWFQKKRIPRPLAVLIIYIFAIAIIATAISFLIAPLVSETQGLGQSFPSLLEKLSGYFNIVHDYAASHNFQQQISNFSGNVADRFSQLGTNIFSGTISFIGGIFSFLVVLSIAFYMSVQEKGVKKFFASISPDEHGEYVVGLVDRIQFKMGRWLLGQLALMLIVFAIDYVGLLLIGAPYALVLAILAGLLEIVPYVGPIASAVVAASVSFLHGPVTGLLVLALFALTQQLEGYLIAPLVMKRAVGLNPVVVILALLIGAKLGGVLGVIIAVPVATMIDEVVNDLVARSQKNEKTSETAENISER